MADLPPTTQVAVIGAGIMGTSAAYHLAVAGADVTLIERDTIASGSTSKAAGGFRTQFSDELNVSMAIENIRRLERFGDEFDTDIDFKQWGYLMLLVESEIEQFETALELQRRFGGPAEMLTPEEAQLIVPQLSIDDLAGATFSAVDGYCTPEAVALGYARRAGQLGATIVQGCEVQGLAVDAGRVTGINTSRGYIACDQVVLTAGAWSGDLAATVGLDLPITPEKRYVWLTHGPDAYPNQLPLVIDFSTKFYFHREGDGLLIGGKEHTLEELAPAVANRVPSMLDLEIRPGWWGYYEITPDHNALVGTDPATGNIHYAAGFSGHGFQQGPVVGEHLSELTLGTKPTFDLGAFDAARFSGGAPVPEKHFV